jgi:anti-sigma regulatory factor (Ser/Thr protein kinase)
MFGESKFENSVISLDDSNHSGWDLISPFARGQEVRLSLPSDRCAILPVIEMLRDLAESFGVLSDREQMPISIALEEALTNAMVHGNLEVSSALRNLDDDSFEQLLAIRSHKRPYGTRRVEITAVYTHDEARFTICDEGPGFDASSVPDPTDDDNICLNHGRGLFLMRSFMDEVIHNSVGNQVTLVKRKKSADVS